MSAANLPLRSRSQREWTPQLVAPRREEAIRLARGIGETLANPDALDEIVRVGANESPIAHLQPWTPSSLAFGDAGLALLFGALDAALPEERWIVHAHRHLEKAARSLETDAGRLPLTLFAGTTAVAFSASVLAMRGPRYARLLQKLDESIFPLAVAAADRLSPRDGASTREYDLLAGLAGLGAYVSTRTESAPGREALARIAASYVALCRSRPRLGFATPPHLMAADGPEMGARYPWGYINCGVAHGLPGPLMILTLAREQGVGVDGVDDAITTLVEWLVEQRYEDVWGPNWPAGIPLHPEERGRTENGTAPMYGRGAPGRTAWCYGSPGVAPILWRAGAALGQTRWCDRAVEAIRASVRRPPAERLLDSPTFCHGVAGHLASVMRMANETQLPDLFTAAEQLTSELLAMHEAAVGVGFRNTEKGGVRVASAGFLDGAAGVAAVLLAAATPSEPVWDRAFLLS